VVLEWGWTDEERRADPWAREFRLYWQPNPPDLIRGEVTGPATWTGTVYEVPTVLSHDVTADQFVGEFIRAGGYSFRIAGHEAGNAPVFRLEPSQLGVTPQPVPGPGTFQLRRVLSGEELRPLAWAERTGTRSANENLILASTAARGVPCRHGNTTCIPARGVGTDPTRSASLYSSAGSVSGDLGIHGPRLTGSGPHVTGTAEPNLTEFLTPTFERPATARTATSPAESSASRRATGSPWPYAHPETCGRSR